MWQNLLNSDIIWCHDIFFKQIRPKLKNKNPTTNNLSKYSIFTQINTVNEYLLYLTMGIICIIMWYSDLYNFIFLSTTYWEHRGELSSQPVPGQRVPYQQLFLSGPHSGWWRPWRFQFSCHVHCFEQNWEKKRRATYNLNQPPLSHTHHSITIPQRSIIEKKN